MRAVDTKMFRALRGAARGRARANARIWKEYKRRRRARPANASSLPQWSQRALYQVALALAAVGFSGRVGASGLLVLLALYCSGTIFLRANSLGSALYVSWQRYTVMHYPVRDAAFFGWQARTWLVSQAGLFVVCAAVYGYAAANGGGGTIAWLAAGAGAFAQSGVVVALALSLVRWAGRVRVKPALVFYVVIAAIAWFPERTLGVMERIVLVLPAAWINQLFITAGGGSIASLGSLLGLAVAGAAVDAGLVRELRKSYPRWELEVVERVTAEQASEDEEAEGLPESAAGAESFGRDFAVSREKFAALRNRSSIESGLAKAAGGWVPDHWTSRMAARWMTEREKRVADFLVAGGTDGWRKRSKLTLQLTAAGLVVSVIPLPIPLWLPLSLFALGAAGGGPLLGGKWPGLTVGQFGFGRFQPCAGYPAGYREASKAMMKWNAARMLGFAPIALAGGVAVGWRYFSAPFEGALVAAQILVLALAVQPYCCAFQHSAGTNDTKKWSRTGAWLALALAVDMAMFLPAAFCFLALRSWALTWVICVPAMFLLSFSMWHVYGYFYNRGRIDLQSAGQ